MTKQGFEHCLVYMFGNVLYCIDGIVKISDIWIGLPFGQSKIAIETLPIWFAAHIAIKLIDYRGREQGTYRKPDSIEILFTKLHM